MKGKINMKKKTNNIKLISTGKYIPNDVITNEDLEKIVKLMKQINRFVLRVVI